MVVAGIDGCHSGWIAVKLDETDVTTVTKENFTDLWDECTYCESVLVDVPIGLTSAQQGREKNYKRDCDTLARKRIASSSSVVQVPVREAVDTYHDCESREPDQVVESVIDKQIELTGKSLTSQARSLLPKIAEVDEFVRNHQSVDELSTVLFEGHPELCFTTLNGGEPLESSKSCSHSDAGLAERYEILNGVFEGDTATELWKALGDTADAEVTFDDVLDAFALALAAREPVATLPESSEADTDPETDWPIVMAYAPPSAFDGNSPENGSV